MTAGIRPRLKAATWPNGKYEWGIYVERHDGDHWLPLIYGGDSEAEARQMLGNWTGDTHRNERLVRRPIGAWEVRS